MRKKLLTIGDISKISGIHIKSLRYYDKIGVLKPAYVDPDTKYRYYSHQQIVILDAIRTCIELDIPLKEFSNFTEDDGHIIHYAELLEQGKKLANEKIHSIFEGIKSIELLQREIERSAEIQNQTEPLIIEMPSKVYYVVPFEGEISKETYYDSFQFILLEATQSGYKTGYELGKLCVYKKTDIKQYDFVEVLASPKGTNKNIITIPKGHGVSKCVSTSRIQNAEEEFPDFFSMDCEKIVIETELFTKDYNVIQPVFELSCILPDTDIF